MTHWYRQFILSVFVGLFGVLVNLTPWGLLLEEKFGLFWLFNMRGEIAAPHDVVVISIDQPSATQLGLPITPSTWPRYLHAQLIENLTAAGARVIAIDLVFDKPSEIAENDEILAHAINKARNVVLVERLGFEETELFMDESDLAHSRIAKEGPTQLLPIIADAAVAHSPFPLPKAARVNDYWTFKASAGDVPTMAVAVLQVFTLPVYNDFVRLLHSANPAYAAKLPVDKDTVDIEDLIFTLRNIFVQDPQIKKQMEAALSRDTKLDATARKYIYALLNLYAGDAVRYLNFYGPPRSIQTVPYYQVLQLDSMALSEWPDFKNKAVFVGFSAMTQPEQDKVRDDYHTVFSSVDGLFISGVEIAATAFANLLENRPIRPLSSEGNLGILFFLGLCMGLIFLLLPNRSAIALSSLLIALYIFNVYYQFKEASIWLPLIVPLLLQMPLALFGALSLKYMDAKRERQQLKDAFGYFLPDRVVNDIAKSAGPIISNNQLVYGTCLATDADRYTSLAESMDPLPLSLLMNEYYAVLFEPVKRHNGIVSDVVGDAMLAIWAAPVATPNLRKQACLACLDIAAAIEHFNQNSNNPPLHTRIGLHFGEMLLGSIGAGHHYEYRAVGDMVNTANRIQGANKYLGTRLLISTDVTENLDDFLIRPLGDFLLAGKSSSVNLAELITHKQTANNEQLWLCETFAAALYAYQSQRWDEACAGFLNILETHPKDGPAKFFLALCQQCKLAPPKDNWQHVIHIEGK